MVYGITKWSYFRQTSVGSENYCVQYTLLSYSCTQAYDIFPETKEVILVSVLLISQLEADETWDVQEMWDMFQTLHWSTFFALV